MAHDVRRFFECRLGRVLVADTMNVHFVVWQLLPDLRRVRRYSVCGRDNGRQFLVIDHDHLGRVLCLCDRIGDDKSNIIADIADRVGRQMRLCAGRRRRAVPQMPLRHRGLKPQSCDFRMITGQNQTNAGRRFSRACVDRRDLRMRQRRPEHTGM